MSFPLGSWRLRLGVCSIIGACLALFVALRVAADDRAEKDAGGDRLENKFLREQMRLRLKRVKVAVVDDPERLGEIVDAPLLTYVEQRRSVDSATFWTWSLKPGGRPLAICKLEHFEQKGRAGSQWLYCFNSLSSKLIQAEWPDGQRYVSRKPGVTFQDLPDQPKPGKSEAERLRQIKDFSRRFTASFDFYKSSKEELRLLIQPVYRYSDPDSGIVNGAAFAVTIQGTNPAALVLVELQQDGDAQRWKFANTAMTDGGVTMSFDGKEVWSKESEFAPGKSFDDWTYFFELPGFEIGDPDSENR